MERRNESDTAPRKEPFAVRYIVIRTAVCVCVVQGCNPNGRRGDIDSSVASSASGIGRSGRNDHMDRTVLPIQEPRERTITELDVRKVASPAPPFHVEAPVGAPNVVIVMLDDMGFGAPSAFGGGV